MTGLEVAGAFVGVSESQLTSGSAAPGTWGSCAACSLTGISPALADGFIPGVEQRHGLGAISRASAFLLPGFSVFDVEHAAAFAAVEDVTTFHNSDFLCPML